MHTFGGIVIYMKQLNLFDIDVDNSDSETESDDDSVVSEYKVCRICNEEKSLDNFYLDRGTPYSKCKECSAKYGKELRAVHKVAPPKPERCECCNKIPAKWICDHYPNSKIFRGWVCFECNNAAGSVGDTYHGAVNLLNYLFSRK